MKNKRPANKRKRHAVWQQLSKLKRFAAKNFVSLLSIGLSLLSSFVIYWLAYSEPDIRAITTTSGHVSYNKPIKDRDGGCLYYFTVKQSFKNLSTKSGYIDKVSFIPTSLDVIPEFNLINIDKSKFGWGEEKEIEVMSSVVLTPDACKVLVDHDEHLIFGMDFYDNTGKLLNKDTTGESFNFTSEFTFEGQTSTQQMMTNSH